MGLRSGIDVFYCFVSFVRLFDAHFCCFLGHFVRLSGRHWEFLSFSYIYLFYSTFLI